MKPILLPESGVQSSTPFLMEDWFAEHHARSNDLNTSHLAAISMKEDAKAIAARIFKEIVQNGPGTQTTLAERTRLPTQQVWKRLSDLKNWGYIKPSGYTMPGPSGRAQTVWTISDVANSVLAQAIRARGENSSSDGEE